MSAIILLIALTFAQVFFPQVAQPQCQVGLNPERCQVVQGGWPFGTVLRSVATCGPVEGYYRNPATGTFGALIETVHTTRVEVYVELNLLTPVGTC